MDAFTRFYGNNARLPGPLARGGSEEVIPGELAPPPRMSSWNSTNAPSGISPDRDWVGSLHPSGLVWTGGVNGSAEESAEAQGPEDTPTDLTGIQAMRPASEWAASSGTDTWRSYWTELGTNSALAAVEGIATAPGFGSLFASTECLQYANGVCAMHGAAILPGSLASNYDIGSVGSGLMGLGRVERCGCGISKTKSLD